MITPHPATQFVAQRVRALREKSGFTHEDLADRMTESGLPWHRSTVVKLENNRRESVTLQEIMALAAVFQCPVTALIPGEAICEHCYGAPPPGYICATCDQCGPVSGKELT